MATDGHVTQAVEETVLAPTDLKGRFTHVVEETVLTITGFEMRVSGLIIETILPNQADAVAATGRAYFVG